MPRRLERQLRMTLKEMLDDLPRAADVGVKQGAKGHRDHGAATSCISMPPMAHSAQLHPDLGVAA